MVVTDIKEYTKSKYEIYLNDEFAFVLYKSELKQFDIRENESLSEVAYEEIMTSLLPKRAKKRAMNLLLKNDLTEKKLREKLKDNKYPELCINEAVNYVKNYHYVDDSRYAHSYIVSKAPTTSKSVIRNKLIEKGISKTIIEDELSKYYELDPLNENVEDDLIKQLIIKKCKGEYNLDYNSRQKLFSYLYRKGFSLDKIERIYNSFCLT